MCLKTFIENYHSPWKLILSYHLKNYGHKFLLHCNYDVADLSKFLPKFYRKCLEAWATVTNTQPSSCDHIMEQILWNNVFVLMTNLNFCKKSFMAGISKINDILPLNGKLKPWNFFTEKGRNLNNYLLILGLSKALLESWEALLNSETTSMMLLSISRFGSTDFT